MEIAWELDENSSSIVDIENRNILENAEISVSLLSDGVRDVDADQFAIDLESMFDQTPSVLDQTPPIRDIGTPNLSLLRSGSENDSQLSLGDNSANDILKTY